MDDHRVDIGNIKARLDDRRGDQHVDFPVDELDHDALEVIFAHLPVGEGDRRLRHELRDAASHVRDVRDPVVDIVDLASPGQLAADGLADHLRVLLRDERLDRHAVLGRLRQD